MAIKSTLLAPGDIIGIVSPSSEIKSFPRRLERGMENLRKQGYQLKLLPNALNKFGNEAGSVDERVQDIHEAFRDPTIKAIMASTGGYTANTLLNDLDFELIRHHPKIFIGFSDITALLIAVYIKTGLITFHGPTVLPSFGPYEGPHPLTVEHFNAAVNGTMQPGYSLSDLGVFSEDNYFWDRDDDVPKSFRPSEGLVTVHEGKASGTLIGGNLETLLSIFDTTYLPGFENAILFLEESGGTFEETKRNLATLEMKGAFQAVNGLVFGRTYRYRDGTENNNLETNLKTLCNKYSIPCLMQLPIGHTEPKLTLPIGVNAELDAGLQKLTILDSGVC